MWLLSVCGRWIILALLTGAARGQAQCYVTTAAPPCVQLERSRPFVVTCTLVCGTSVPVSYFRLRLLSVDAYFECGHRGKYETGSRISAINWTCTVSQPRTHPGADGSSAVAGVIVSATYRLQWTDGNAPSERMFSDLLCSSVWTDMTLQPDDGGRPTESRDPVELRLPNCNKAGDGGSGDGGGGDGSSSDDHTLILVVISGAVGLCCVAVIAWAICRCDKSILVARFRSGDSFGGTSRPLSRVASRPSSCRQLVRSSHDVRSAASPRQRVTADGIAPRDSRYASQFGQQPHKQHQQHQQQHQQQYQQEQQQQQHQVATGGEAGATAPETFTASEDWWVWSYSAPTSGVEQGAPQAAAAGAAGVSSAHRPPPPIVTSAAPPQPPPPTATSKVAPSAAIAYGAPRSPAPQPSQWPTATSKAALAPRSRPASPQQPSSSSPKTAETPRADVVFPANAVQTAEVPAVGGQGDRERSGIDGGVANAEGESSSSATSTTCTSSSSTPPSPGAPSKGETLVTVFVPSRTSFALRSKSRTSATAKAKVTARMLQKASRQSMARASRAARSTADFMAKNFRIG